MEIADSLMKNGVKKMYHALVNKKDIQTIFTIPKFKIFWCFRCHLVADDGSTAHEHLHALVQYKEGAKRFRRAGHRFNSKTTFKQIICPDHAIEVLRYVTCRDGERATRRDAEEILPIVTYTIFLFVIFIAKTVYAELLVQERN